MMGSHLLPVEINCRADMGELSIRFSRGKEFLCALLPRTSIYCAELPRLGIFGRLPKADTGTRTFIQAAILAYCFAKYEPVIEP